MGRLWTAVPTRSNLLSSMCVDRRDDQPRLHPGASVTSDGSMAVLGPQNVARYAASARSALAQSSSKVGHHERVELGPTRTDLPVLLYRAACRPSRQSWPTVPRK